MGFGQGLSGLNAAAQNLDVIGNNIANAGTVGFKTGNATFADVYANSRVGLGVQVTGVTQRFTAGTVANTGNMFDMAIDGEKGFFRLVDESGAVYYSRNGQFIADKNNFIVNAQGQQLTGYPPGGVGTAPMPLTVPTGNIPPQATSEMAIAANLDDTAADIPATPAFDPADPATFTNRQAATAYDSLGNAHTFAQYFIKRSGGTWDVHYSLDGVAMDVPPGGGPLTLNFDANGILTSPPNQTVTANTPGGMAAPLTVALDYSAITAFGGSSSFGMTLNGYATGEYIGMSVTKDGALMANYTNGQIQEVGVLALAKFSNPNGLQPVGGNAWVERAESGPAVLDRPGSNGLATIKSQAIEESNVDMSQELVNMIIAQRTYQANAQTIKTQDQILQTLITMR